MVRFLDQWLPIAWRQRRRVTVGLACQPNDRIQIACQPVTPASPVTHPKVKPMTRTPEKNFLRAWREYRRMTQAQLAEAVDTTGAVISLLEAGHRGLSDKWLRKLAPVLGTSPGHLLDVDPNDVSSDILEVWAGVPEDNREQVLNIIKTFVTLKDPKARSAALEKAQQPKAARGRKGPK